MIDPKETEINEVGLQLKEAEINHKKLMRAIMWGEDKVAQGELRMIVIEDQGSYFKPGYWPSKNPFPDNNPDPQATMQLWQLIDQALNENKPIGEAERYIIRLNKFSPEARRTTRFSFLPKIPGKDPIKNSLDGYQVEILSLNAAQQTDIIKTLLRYESKQQLFYIKTENGEGNVREVFFDFDSIETLIKNPHTRKTIQEGLSFYNRILSFLG